MPETAPYATPQKGESAQAFYAFCKYRDLPPSSRSLAEVTRLLSAEKEGSGLKFPGTDKAQGKHQKSGKVGEWSSKFHWVERALAWDQYCDSIVRARQLDEIQRMARRHAQQNEILLQDLMAPAIALAKALRDPDRVKQLDNAHVIDLLKATILSSQQVPKVQKAEKLSRGVKVVDQEPLNAPGTSQGGAEWRVVVHQPERKEPLPDLNQLADQKADEWE